jgi:small subunit ribosomal protein S1
VIEFNKEFKRIVVSHTSTFKEEERPARVEKEAKKAAPVNEVTAEVKSTLGDLDALVELKKKMEEGK